MSRYIGVDLHTTQITVCYLKEGGKVSTRKYQLCEVEKFGSELRKTEEIADWVFEDFNNFVLAE